MVPENKQNRRYKQINFIGLQNNHHPSQHTSCRMAAIQERVTAVLRSIPKEAFADTFQKVYERCQQCVVKDGDYFEDQ
jgi:methylmalonyl-CoA mutase cobalamin-binding subunit